MINLQFITNQTTRFTHQEATLLALKGGCRWIQLRMKEEVPVCDRLSVACQVKALCKQYDAIFIIDDYVELAKQVGADGVHVGLTDMPVGDVRSLLGSGYLIGGTANTFEQMEQHIVQGADYVGCGPYRFTTTKKNLAPLLGLEGYRKLIQQLRQHQYNLPVVAIGGVLPEDIEPLMDIGIAGIAVSGSVLQAPRPIEAMEEIVNRINKYI